MHLVGTAIGAFSWNSISELYTPPPSSGRILPSPGGFLEELR
jgi:hypothetical protein